MRSSDWTRRHSTLQKTEMLVSAPGLWHKPQSSAWLTPLSEPTLSYTSLICISVLPHGIAKEKEQPPVQSDIILNVLHPLFLLLERLWFFLPNIPYIILCLMDLHYCIGDLWGINIVHKNAYKALQPNYKAAINLYARRLHRQRYQFITECRIRYTRFTWGKYLK